MNVPGYWDIHNHILPGVDDGSGSAAESMDMLEAEYSQGVRNVVFTPHFREGMFTVAADVRESVFKEFSEAAAERFPEMRLFLGCELHVSDNMLARHARAAASAEPAGTGASSTGPGSTATAASASSRLDAYLADVRCRMAGTRAVLVEFSGRAQLNSIHQITGRVIDAGGIPIIAHAERCDELRANPEAVRQLRSAGALIQINADTILEGIFSPRKKFAKKLLEMDAVDFIASDAHDTEVRPVRMEAAVQAIRKKFGDEKAERLFRENAEAIFGAR